MANACLFCDIVSGALAADIVAHSEHAIAFLDARPLFKGHVLVAPRTHLVTLAELPAAALSPLFGAVQRVARAVEAGLGVDGSFVAINNRVSQSVPHLHVHVVPRRKGDGLRGFFWPRTKYHSDDEQERVRAAIAAALRD